jgi:predicted transposase YbfD/YdcC
MPPFLAHFATLPDPRIDRSKLHALLDLLVIALCTLLCGGEGWEDMTEFGQAKERFFREQLGLSLAHGIPSPDTFRRLFARLDPEAFTQCFTAWVASLRRQTKGEVVSIDGKTLRHSFDTATGQAPIHVISAWASKNRLVLGQLKVEDKSNEIPAIPALLALLDLRGCTVTLDAMGCQKEIARQIIAQEGEYVLSLKGNQGTLHADVAEFFEDARQREFAGVGHQYTETVEKDHGRIEKRRYWLVEAVDWLVARHDWVGLHSISMIERIRQVGTAVTSEVSYTINSLTGSVAKLARAARSHWGIENQVHYVLDVTFDEDACRIRKENAPQNLATARHIALNLLRQEKTSRRGIKGRIRRACWDDEYLLRVLAPNI